MKISYKLAAIVLLALSVSACKKVLDLKLSNAGPQLIIEGAISDVAGAQAIYLSRTVGFDDANNYPPVTGAKVTVIDNNSNLRYTCVENLPGTYNANQLLGRPRRSYTLEVVADGKTYKASSTMPSKVIIDSATTSEQTFGKDDNKTVAIYYQDPPNVKNFYRAVMFVNGVQVKRLFVRNDQFTDGKNVQFLLYQNDIDIKSKDRIDVDLYCIDEQVYNYWYTFSQQSNQIGGAATPTNPSNNFNLPVLGYFSAHTLFRRSFIVR